MNRKYFHVLFILFVAATFVVALLPQGRHDEIKGSVLACMAPAQESATFVRGGLMGLTEMLNGTFSFAPEPDAVRRANDEIRRLRQLLAIEQNKSAEMEKTIGGFALFQQIIDPADADQMSVIPAVVIGRDATTVLGMLTINRGGADGVRKGAGVVWGHAAAGVVAVVRPRSAIVNLVTNPACKVPAFIQRTSESTVVEGGDLGDSLRMRHVFREKVLPGDVCLTSGELGTFPRNIIIGEVKQASLPPGSLFQEISVRPQLNLAALQTVIVLVREELQTPDGE